MVRKRTGGNSHLHLLNLHYRLRFSEGGQISMLNGWPATRITVITEAMQIFTELRGKRWLCRGQSRFHGGLTPSIGRDTLKNLPRAEKLALRSEEHTSELQSQS